MRPVPMQSIPQLTQSTQLPWKVLIQWFTGIILTDSKASAGTTVPTSFTAASKKVGLEFST